MIFTPDLLFKLFLKRYFPQKTLYWWPFKWKTWINQFNESVNFRNSHLFTHDACPWVSVQIDGCPNPTTSSPRNLEIFLYFHTVLRKRPWRHRKWLISLDRFIYQSKVLHLQQPALTCHCQCQASLRALWCFSPSCINVFTFVRNCSICVIIVKTTVFMFAQVTESCTFHTLLTPKL